MYLRSGDCLEVVSKSKSHGTVMSNTQVDGWDAVRGFMVEQKDVTSRRQGTS